MSTYIKLNIKIEHRSKIVVALELERIKLDIEEILGQMNTWKI